MDSSILTVIFLQILSQCSARWYMAVRPVYDLGNGTQSLTRTQRTLKKIRLSDRQCRKDRQCGKGRFCYRHSGTCHSCRRESELCRRSHMCCKGFACVSGFCRPVIPTGIKGSVCRKSKDCKPGFCCSRTTGGDRVCRRFLQEGDVCGLPEMAPLFRLNHFCPCGSGLKCKKVRRISKRAKGNPGWSVRKERRCARVT